MSDADPQTLEILRLGHRGDGIAEGPVFVNGGLPGEVVEGVITDGRLAAPRILRPSELRVSPVCRHYKGCGGCLVQHAREDFVSDWKREIVRQALEAQGLTAPIRGIHTSPPRSRRRATFSGRRTKKGALVGFHGRASDTLVDVPECQLVHPEILATRPALDRLTRAGASRKGEISLTVTLTEDGPDIHVSGGKPLDAALRMEMAGLVESEGLARLTWEDEVIAQRIPPRVRFDGIAVVPPPGAFLQATAEGEGALRRSVLEAVGDGGHVLDLFAGCGTFALPLARRAEVHAVEGLEDLTAALEAGWRQAQGLKAVTVETRDLFRRPLLPDELKRFEAVVIDPPRAGAEAQTEEIARSDVRRVAAVSCNPATFARDAARLVQAGFTLDWVDVVDQFRWSPHVELAACLTRGNIPVRARPKGRSCNKLSEPGLSDRARETSSSASSSSTLSCWALRPIRR
ncbi:23S rRNA m(5)U-1939 methyltransferase [Aliiruegeria haliotis]|uniref:23S rRNA m(5)U-1939 methyltransferase n=1 Tax=Aliiruegeria haliotis TaxID=1280846 RepID=A0A2T0RHL7_9RHOB|nr:RsmD family RNA methyltransferase [Aliiruegeria haliotis]PRY20658.1 23S rRNA m(5)U-1939 methyltransferase [Aliiruegeria haliotis]